MTGLLQAGRLQQDFSDYGIDVPSPININCLDEHGAITGGTCALTAEDYVDSSLGTRHIFDFRVEGAISNYTLTLIGSVPFIADADPDKGPWGYGAFVCDPSLSDPRQCGPDPNPDPDNPTTTFELVDSQTVKFHVAGANNNFVFFAVLPEPVLEEFTALDLSSSCEGTEGEPKVCATLERNTSEVPEPSALPILLLAGSAAIAAFKRRSRKLTA
jgi:hypothetical protein